MSDDETGICPACEQEIPAERLQLHLDGLDGARPECPKQDLVAIAQRAREQQTARSLWSPAWSHRGW